MIKDIMENGLCYCEPHWLEVVVQVLAFIGLIAVVGLIIFILMGIDQL